MPKSQKKRLLQLVKSRLIRMSNGADKSRKVLNELLTRSPNIHSRNFDAFDRVDLEILFQLVDQHFFDGLVSTSLDEGQHSIQFRVSHRMTNSGGITTTRFADNGSKALSFEIAISATLLFESFRDSKPIIVTGLLCGDRVHALKRIMEHEMIHLIEMLLWRNSSCAASRFQNIAYRLFSHKQSTHQLLTPTDTASSEFKIETGDWVKFRVNGRTLLGFVNRITKRATILVPSPKGIKYNDGKRYDKYYVPIERLQKSA